MNDPFGDLGAAPQQDPFADLQAPGFWGTQEKYIHNEAAKGGSPVVGAVKGLIPSLKNLDIAGSFTNMAREGLKSEADFLDAPVDKMSAYDRANALAHFITPNIVGSIGAPSAALRAGPTVDHLAGLLKGLPEDAGVGGTKSIKEFSGGLADKLFELNNHSKIEKTIFRQFLEKLPKLPKETMERLYHYDEADAMAREEFAEQFAKDVAAAKTPEDRLGLLRTSKERADKYRAARNPYKLTAEEQEYFHRYMVPLKGALRKLQSKVYGIPEESLRYGVNRQVKGKNSIVDRIMSQMSRALPWRGKSLSKSATALHRRTMMVMEGQDGSRTVVHLNNGEIVATGPLGDTKLIARYKRIPKAGAQMIAKDGQIYTLREGLTEEIERNSSVRYHKNPILNYIATYGELSSALRHKQFLNHLMSLPEWKKIAVPAQGHTIPKGWYTPKVPQLNGWALEPRVAHVFDDFAKSFLDHGDAERFMEAVNRFMTATLFFNPLPHLLNVGDHWIVERGVSGWVNPQGWVRLVRTGRKAIRAITEQNEDFLEALNNGASMMYADRANANFFNLMLKQADVEITRDPTMWHDLAKMFEYVNPAEMLAGIYKAAGDILWAGNDFFILQRVYELQELHPGMTMRAAIKEAEKHIPNYRIPAEVMGSRGIASLLKNPNFTMFGPYHYGVFRSYSELVKSIVKPLNGAERRAAVDKLLMMGFMAYAFYPMMDAVAKMVTGNKNASFRRFGSSSFPYNLYLISQGQRNLATELATIITPAPATAAGFELLANRDTFTGKPVYQEGDVNRVMHPLKDPKGAAKSAFHIGEDVIGHILDRIAPAALLMGSPIVEGKKSWKQILESQFGIVDPSPQQAAALEAAKAYKERDRAKKDAKR